MLFRAAVLSTLIGLSLGQAATATEPPSKRKVADEIVMQSSAFLSHHPDLRWRGEGLYAYDKGQYRDAFRHFLHAARYADKPSQAMVAQMLLEGQGTAADRALAYAWMDLAAERGYRHFLVQREKIWAQLSPEEQQRAIEEGQKIYAEYGDDVAKPRLEAKLRRGVREMTGSRVGMVGALRIEIPTPSGTQTITGENFYREEFWQPEAYWAWQDDTWKNPPTGSVDVGPLQSTSAAPQTNVPTTGNPR